MGCTIAMIDCAMHWKLLLLLWIAVHAEFAPGTQAKHAFSESLHTSLQGLPCACGHLQAWHYTICILCAHLYHASWCQAIDGEECLKQRSCPDSVLQHGKCLTEFVAHQAQFGQQHVTCCLPCKLVATAVFFKLCSASVRGQLLPLIVAGVL